METIRKNIRNISRQEKNETPQPINCAAIPVLEQTFKETGNDDRGFGYPQIIVAFSFG